MEALVAMMLVNSMILDCVMMSAVLVTPSVGEEKKFQSRRIELDLAIMDEG